MSINVECQAIYPQLWSYNFMNKFAERLKELRVEKGLSIIQLAKETNLSKSAVSYWENCERIPNALAIITLCKYFNVSADYLLGLED